jgi:hypothetical protein
MKEQSPKVYTIYSVANCSLQLSIFDTSMLTNNGNIAIPLDWGNMLDEHRKILSSKSFMIYVPTAWKELVMIFSMSPQLQQRVTNLGKTNGWVRICASNKYGPYL